MFDRNGYYIEDLEGETRYVTRDERGRAVFGPRQRRTHGWMAKLHPRNRRRNGAVVGAESQEGSTMELETEAGTRWGRLRARWRDAEFHKAVQHTAIDVTMWGCGLSLVAVAAKCAYWVVML
jgi:hypothetical protein